MIIGRCLLLVLSLVFAPLHGSEPIKIDERPAAAPQAGDEKLIRFGYKIIGKIDEINTPRNIAEHFIDIKTTEVNPDTYFWNFTKYYIKISLNYLLSDKKLNTLSSSPFYLEGKIYLESKKGMRINVMDISKEIQFKIIESSGKKIKLAKPSEIEIPVNGVDVTTKYIKFLNAEHEWKLVVELQKPIRAKEIQYLSVNWGINQIAPKQGD